MNFERLPDIQQSSSEFDEAFRVVRLTDKNGIKISIELGMKIKNVVIYNIPYIFSYQKKLFFENLEKSLLLVFLNWQSKWQPDILTSSM